MNSQDDQQPPMSLSDKNSIAAEQPIALGSSSLDKTQEAVPDGQDAAGTHEGQGAQGDEEGQPSNLSNANQILPQSNPSQLYNKLPGEIDDDYTMAGKEKKKVDKQDIETLFPESHAFKVENKLRETITDLMGPVLVQRDKMHDDIKDIQDKFQVFENTQQKIQAKLEDTELLRELFLEYEVKMRKMYNDYSSKTESMRKQLSDTVQLTKVHEDKMARISEEIKRMDVTRGQMQEEIREFEKLCQDINDDCHNVIQQIRTDFSDKLDDCRFKLDEQSYVSRDVKLQFQQQKQLYQQLDGQLGWQKYNIDQLLQLTENLPVMYQQVQSTENYLHKILPIKMQTEIYGNCKQLISKDRELKLDFLEYQESIYEDLIANKDRSSKFDKTHYVIPTFQQELKSLKLNQLKVTQYSEEDEEDDEDNPRQTDQSNSDQTNQPSEITTPPNESNKLPIPTIEPKVMTQTVVDEILANKDILEELVKGIEILGVFATAEELNNQVDDLNKERESQLQDILSQIPETIAAQRHTSHLEQSEQHETKETPSREQNISSIRKSSDFRSPSSDKLEKQQHPEPIQEDPDETLTVQEKINEKKEYEAHKRLMAQKRREERNQIRKAQRELEAQQELDELKKRRAQREKEKQDKASLDRDQRSKKSRTKLTDRSREQLETNMRMGTIDSNQTRSPRLRRDQHLELFRNDEKSEHNLAAESNKRITAQVKRLENQMRTVSKRIGLTYSISQSEVGDKEVEDQEQKSKNSEKEDDEESIQSQQLVTYSEFKKLMDQIPELKKNIGNCKSKLIDFERSLFGINHSQQEDGQDNLDGNKMSVSLDDFQNNLKNIEARFIEKLEHVDLLKDQMKCELKRLQRQHFGTNKDFEKQTIRVSQLFEKVLDFNRRLAVSDAAMATIFKLLRIQYALSHQDERDKQNIFLAGFTEVGQVGAQPSAILSPERTNADDLYGGPSIREDTATTSRQELDSRIDGTINTINPIDVQSKIGETPFIVDDQNSQDSKSNIQILYGVSKVGDGSVHGPKKSETNIKKIKMKMVEGIKGSAGTKVLSFDAKCLQGCDSEGNGKNIKTLMKAFKMACLSYKPSPVIFDQKPFDRSSLIEAQGYLLFLALEHMQHLDFDQVEQNLLGASNNCTIQDIDAEMSVLAEDSSIIQGLVQRSRNEKVKDDQINNHNKSIDTDDRTTTINKSNSNEQLLYTPNYFKKLDQISNDKLTISKLTNQQDKIVNFAEYNGSLDNSIDVTQPSYSVQAQTPNNLNTSSRVMTLKNIPSKDRLSRLINPTIHALPTSGLISLSKSKEYARLASQVPTIFQIKDGYKYLNTNEMVGSAMGGLGKLTPQDQYQKSIMDIQNIKLFQKHIKLQNTLKNRSYTSNKMNEEPVGQQQTNHHTQSIVQLHSKQHDQPGIDEIIQSARGNKGLLYSSVNRLQKNQTAEPVEFGGFKNPSAIQFNFQSGPTLNTHMPDEKQNVAKRQFHGSAKLRNGTCSQRKLTVVEPNASYFLKNQSFLHFHNQNALTPQGRMDPNSSRGKFAERFGLIGKDLNNLQAYTTQDTKKYLGGFIGGDYSKWDNSKTPSIDHLDRPTPQNSQEKSNRFAECLSSRPLQINKHGPLIPQTLVGGYSSPDGQSKKHRLEQPMRIVIQQNKNGGGNSLNPLRKILSIKSGNEGPVIQKNEGSMNNTGNRFRFSQVSQQDQSQNKGQQSVSDARQTTSVMPNLQQSKIDTQQFSPRSVENNVI